MSHTYQAISGRLYAPDGKFMTLGYSGHGKGLNNPDLEQVQDVGPIPRGTYRIGSPFHHPKKGEHCMRLTPEPGTETFGRAGFMIHGDSKEHAGEMEASEGCIILPRYARERISDSGDNKLQVI